ncbi:hypothetical protein KC207_16505 [Phycicoccus sp. BSK3Z-2]|uniref:Uncharacterized protein n=1 Tax=Phycicoccus avicenniae TaxID=2828860 RepID=A0A941DEM5_9MICO|nr:aminoglycoside phosphotransferase family protein [Phycicoccus avicenniae]MBR7744897.1 hypothetical protein [Phycicoccus avicenniae]
MAAAALVAALPSRGLLLHPRLEPLDDAWWDDPVCEAVGALLRRLRVPAPPSVPTIATVVPPLLERLPHLPSVPRRVATRTRGLAADLLGSEGTLPRLLHGALDDRALRLDHGDPVAVLPEPLAGHPAWDVWPAVRMRPADLGTGTALRWSVRHRLALVADAAGLDPEEARAWTLLRAGVEVARTAESGADETALSLDLAVMKALDD